MNWNEVLLWLLSHNHVGENWERIETEDGVYCEDSFENTFLSVFTRADGELIVYVGMPNSKVSVGRGTGVYVEDYWDVIAYLEDNLEDIYTELMNKAN